jgi:ABC-type phosphate transport system substrate-binding protein
MKIAAYFNSTRLIFLVGLAFLTQPTNVALYAAVIVGDYVFADPILKPLVKAYHEDQHPKVKLQIQCQADWGYSEAFGRGQSDGLLAIGPLPFVVPSIIASSSPDGNFTHWQQIKLGEIRVVAIVHTSNKIAGLTLEQIQKLLIGRRASVEDVSQKHRIIDQGNLLHWTDLGGHGGLITCYGEHDESTSRKIIREQAMMFTDVAASGQPGARITGYYPFRDNFALCADAEDVIQEVARDRNGIGFIAFMGKLPEGVRIVPLAKKTTGPFIAPNMNGNPQADYPLQETITLHVHPSASAPFHDFAKWVSGPVGVKTLHKIPGYAKSATKEQSSESKK